MIRPKAAAAAQRHPPVLLRALGYLRPYRRMTLASYAALLAAVALSIAIPQLIRFIVDHGLGRDDAALLGRAVAGLLVLTLFKGLIGFAQGRWTETSSQGVAYDLRRTIHRKLAAMSFSYHDRAETGQLLSRAVQDVERIRFLTGRALLRLAEGMVLAAATMAALLTMDARLAGLALCIMPLLAVNAYYFGRRLRPLGLHIQRQLGTVTAQLEQNLRGVRVVKAFAQEAAETAAFDAENDRWFEMAARQAALQARNDPQLSLIANLAAAAVIGIGGWLAVRGELSLGELVAFTTYLGQLVQPVRRVGNIIPALAIASAAGERIFEIIDAQSEVEEAPDAVLLPRLQGCVRFENVSFAYFGRHVVLSDVSFEVRPGSIVALLGATGSGKSTIINLIPRFYDPTSGRITLDGHDIRAVTLNSLRDQVGFVLQETLLFAASVRENIAFGRPDAALEEVIAAARAAQAHDFISEMPQGYDTPVGERGVTLSGGQKQRIAIARALLKDPRILILDDAMSSVDTETEHLIRLALEQLMRGRTCFIIAQRPSTLRSADLILVLEQGRMVARGTRDELMATSGLYAEMMHR